MQSCYASTSVQYLGAIIVLKMFFFSGFVYRKTLHRMRNESCVVLRESIKEIEREMDGRTDGKDVRHHNNVGGQRSSSVTCSVSNRVRSPDKWSQMLSDRRSLLTTGWRRSPRAGRPSLRQRWSSSVRGTVIAGSPGPVLQRKSDKQILSYVCSYLRKTLD